jgi:hypothetical protein
VAECATTCGRSASVVREKNVKEELNSIEEVPVCKLTELALRVGGDPNEAVAIVKQFFDAAKAAKHDAYQKKRSKEWQEELAKAPRENWASAVKQITLQNRRDRAELYFAEFMKAQWPDRWEERLDQLKRDKFNFDDIDSWRRAFEEWCKQPQRKKGKQGRRVSEHDGRLRTPLGRLLPKKSRKRV